MLNVLKFKKSLCAGVLDGGEREAFLGGSRLARFMESLEKTRDPGAIGESSTSGRGEERAAERVPKAAATPAPAVVAASGT